MNILNGNRTNPQAGIQNKNEELIRKGTITNQKGIYRFRNMRAKHSWKIELKS